MDIRIARGKERRKTEVVEAKLSVSKTNSFVFKPYDL
jgi:hypothetical protein